MKFTVARKLTLAHIGFAIIIVSMVILAWWQLTNIEIQLGHASGATQSLDTVSRDKEMQPQTWQVPADTGLQIQGTILRARQLIIAAGLFGLLAVLYGYFLLARGIVRPLQELGAAHNANARGDLSRRVHVYAQDEFGVLAESFNQMAGKIEHGVNIEQRAMQYTLLREITEQLQTSPTLEAAYQVIAPYAERIFAGIRGGLGIISASKSLISTTASWGNCEILPKTFHSSDCWALRRSREHLSTSPDAGPVCGHFTGAGSMPRLCVPIIMQGECIGVLCLESNTADEKNSVQLPEVQELAVMVADGIGLCLSNLILQDALRHQSTHDALTGLHNRLYLDEALMREVSRAERYRTKLAVIMLDLDYFKQINDKYGHSAGDKVLEHTGQLISGNIRTSDIACRYGGEEFVVILPQISPEQTRERAEQLLALFRSRTITYNHQNLEPVTCSMGIAVFPEHGRTTDEILQVADQALYAAKSQGRNCYCLPEDINTL